MDESQSLWVSTKSLNQVITLNLLDVQVPLYEILLHLWIQIFGASITSARIMSFLFLLFTLPSLYLLGKDASNKKVAIVTVTLFTLSPFIMWYSSEARTYTLFTFITTLNQLFFLRFLKSNGKTGKLGYFISTIIGFYTHYFFTLLVITQITFLLFRCFKFEQEGNKHGLVFLATSNRKEFHLFLKHILLVFLSCLFFLPWVIIFIRNGVASNDQPLIPKPTSYNIFQSFVNFIFGFQNNAIQSILISFWPLILLTFFLIFTKHEKINIENISYFIMVTIFPIILVFAGSFIKPIFLTRYLILVTPTLFFLIAWTLVSFAKSKAEIILTILLIVMFGLLGYQNISAQTPVKEDYSQVSNYLENHVEPDDIITVSAPFTIYPIEYTYARNNRIDTIPLWDRYSQGAIPPFTVNNLAAQIKSYQSTYTHLFVVLSYDQGYQSKIENYLDTHYKRLLLKNFSPGLQIREYLLRYD